MKFEIKETYYDISEEDLILDLRETCFIMNKNSLTIAEYNENGKYSAATYQRKFGAWGKALTKANLNNKGHVMIKSFDIEEIVSDLKNVAFILKKDNITAEDYDKHGIFSSATLRRKYGSWNKVLSLAEMTPNINILSDEKLFDLFGNLWIKCGRQPLQKEVNLKNIGCSFATYRRRFGTWNNFLKQFEKYMDSNFDEIENQNIKEIEPDIIMPFSRHKTSRSINMKLRYNVLKRDNFKCNCCGASPAKDPSVVLHIDHIIPWAKGGETVYENLQTLCSNCNFGKSDDL